MGINGSQSTAGLKTHGSKKRGRERKGVEIRGRRRPADHRRHRYSPEHCAGGAEGGSSRRASALTRRGRVAPSASRRDREVSTSDTGAGGGAGEGGERQTRGGTIDFGGSSLECGEVLRRGALDLRREERRFAEVLRMTSCLSYRARPSWAAKGVAEAVRNNSALSTLDIDGDWFGDDDAEALGHALAANTSVERLDLTDCSFGARGLKSIAEALKSSNTINYIDLDNMVNIGDAGAEIMADLLSSTSSLKSIALIDCGIGAPGSTSIAKALQINTSLKSLYMYNNMRIGDAGAAALADVLASTTSLTWLWLDGCGIGEQGALALGRALGANLALPLAFELASFNDYDIPGAEEEAARVRALVLLRREKLLAFGMAMIKRLGGGTSAEEGSTSPSRERSTFHNMCKDVFRLVGEAYVD